jgi:hypothetical protein
MRHILAVVCAVTVVVGCQQSAETAGSADEWSRHAVAAELPLGAVIAAGDGFVAINGRDDRGRGSMWHSADGLTWERVGQTGEEQPLVDVIAGGPGYVAVPSQGGPVWTSLDGRTWTEGPADPDMLAAFPMAAAERDGLLVVVGRGGVVLVSRDAMEWEPIGLPGGQGVIHDVVATEAGFVAVGSVSLGSMEANGVVWTSVDGETWTRLADDPGFERSELFRVAASGDRVVATGYANDLDSGLFATPMAWTSVGGGAWHRATVVDPFLPAGPLPSAGPTDLEGAVMGPIVRTTAGWVSAGQAWSIEDYPQDGGGVRRAVASDLGLWTSTDGTTWRRLPPHPRFELGLSEGSPFGPGSMVFADARVIVFGVGERGMAAWINPAQPGGVDPSPRSTPIASRAGP